jgi:hypothetical protein
MRSWKGNRWSRLRYWFQAFIKISLIYWTLLFIEFHWIFIFSFLSLYLLSLSFSFIYLLVFLYLLFQEVINNNNSSSVSVDHNIYSRQCCILVFQIFFSFFYTYNFRNLSISDYRCALHIILVKLTKWSYPLTSGICSWADPINAVP